MCRSPSKRKKKSSRIYSSVSGFCVLLSRYGVRRIFCTLSCFWAHTHSVMCGASTPTVRCTPVCANATQEWKLLMCYPPLPSVNIEFFVPIPTIFAYGGCALLSGTFRCWFSLHNVPLRIVPHPRVSKSDPVITTDSELHCENIGQNMLIILNCRRCWNSHCELQKCPEIPMLNCKRSWNCHCVWRGMTQGSSNWSRKKRLRQKLLHRSVLFCWYHMGVGLC